MKEQLMDASSDNIGKAESPAADPKAAKAAKAERRREISRQRSADWRLNKRRSLPPEPADVADAMVLCLLDALTLPPSKRQGRREVLDDVMRQAFRTLQAMGHPEVGRSVDAYLKDVQARLRTQSFHHPVRHALQR